MISRNPRQRGVTSRTAPPLENTGENANSRGPHPRLFVLTRVPQSSRQKCLAPRVGFEPTTNRLTAGTKNDPLTHEFPEKIRISASSVYLTKPRLPLCLPGLLPRPV